MVNEEIEMARQDKQYKRRSESREGLLRAEKAAALRPSLEDACRSSLDSDEHLDELDLNADDNLWDSRWGRWRRWSKRSCLLTRPPWSTGYTHQDSQNKENPNSSRQRRWLARRRSWLIVALILALGFSGLVGSGALWVYSSAPPDGQSPPWYPTPKGGTLSTWEESYKKASAMVGKMSLIEKVNITTGTGWSMGFCVGSTGPANIVGFPQLCLQDGPLGLRFADHSSAFPAAITVGATWNRDLMYQRGRAHGQEARDKGVNVLLGPAMGPLGKMPAGGRNWEGFGPDPVLQAVGASQTIKGIQDAGVIATAKHFVGNEQEHFRQSFEWGLPNAISSNIDDRTLHELYIWPFAESIRAGVGSVMCSYNQLNNSYACGNSKLLNGILKDELGFQGFVVSDWLAQRSGVASALAGLDMSMPGDGLRWKDGRALWGGLLTKAVLNGSVPLERLNDMVTRTVAAWYQLKQDNETEWPAPPPKGDGGPNFSSWTKEKIGLVHHGSGDNETAVVNQFINVQGNHSILAQQIAAEGAIVVKNEDNILPLSRKGRLGKTKYRVGIFGEDAGPGLGPNVCLDRACNQGTLASGWGSGAVDFPMLVTPFEALKDAFHRDAVQVDSHLSNIVPIKGSAPLLHDKDLCLAFVNSDSGEGYLSWRAIRGDRNDLYLQKDGDKLVQQLAEGCGNGAGDTIVIVHAVGAVVLERWIDLPGVKAVVLANLPGEKSGDALVDVLFGEIDASGRLPYTVGKSLEDYGKGGQVLYYPNNIVPQQNFDEGLYIDYRHFDKYNITPRYEFGFGLSYTTWSFSDLTLTPLKPKTALPDPRPELLQAPTYSNIIPDPSTALFPNPFRALHKYIYPYISSVQEITSGTYPYPEGYTTVQPLSPAGGGEGGNPSLFEPYLLVNVTVTNTGARKGKQVVQLYLSYPDQEDIIDESTGEKVDFPVKVLRGFEKVEVEKGEKVRVAIKLTRKDFSYWSTGRGNWVMPTKGKFTIRVGASSRDLPLTGEW